MKKAILLIIFTFISLNFGLTLAQSSTMPSDEEIRKTIEKFDFDDTQKEFLFKETKKKLEQMYKNGELDSKVLEQTSNENSQAPTIQKEDKPQKTKKYANHDPLTKKQRLGPKRDR